MKIENKSILFLGVGGVSMHQLAIAFKQMGATVYGYDAKENIYTEKCKECGILVFHKPNKKYANVDLCIKTAAIKEDNKFVQLLLKNNVEIVDRKDALAYVCSKFKNVIAVAGTHGKSTTASLIYNIFRSANKKVSCHIGADVFNARFNLKDDYLVVEACEYNKSFLSLFPTISVITNVEAEHMDSYKSLFNLRNAFATFLKRGKERFVFLEKSTEFLKKYKNINFVSNDNSLKPQIKGEYNLKNVSLAVSVARYFGINENIINKVVKNFKGIPRRYEYIGKINNKKAYIDYAHHPTELECFLRAFLKEESAPLIVFQPHTYSRTKLLKNDFLNVLKNVENLILFKEYSARETKDKGMSAKQLFEELKEVNNSAIYCDNLKELKRNIDKFSAIAFVGAGDINEIAKKIIQTN